MDMTKVGGLISGRRKELGLTQQELGLQLGVSAKAVSKWERGLSCPDVALIGQLAAALRVSIVELLSGEVQSADGGSCYRPGETGGELCGILLDVQPLTIEPKGGLGTVVSPYLFGENLEHTRSDIFMGLSAQMLRNRKFAGKPMACSGHPMEWYPIGEKTFFAQCEPYARHYADFYHMRRSLEGSGQRIVNIYGGESGIGQHEIPVFEGKEYEFRIVAKAAQPIELRAALTDRGGGRVYAEGKVMISGEEWTAYALRLKACETDPDGDLRITFEDEGCLSVGAVSLMPSGHFRGMRRDVIEKLREMGVRLLRWPGGNFAGEYCWADGLLPADMRAPFESYLRLETQPHSLGYDYHEINTDDFIALCREIGAEPFITINPTWNTPEENAAWVEYCNGGPETKYGAMRAERGYEAPYNVQFWSLGNEFGYGHMEGSNTPYDYSRIARSNAEKMLEVSQRLSLCTSGPYPHGESREWAEHAAKPLAHLAQLVSLHYYAPSPTYTDPALLKKEYCDCLASVETARSFIHTLRSMLSDSLKISFDEWNTWYAWYRPSSIFDGLFTALMLHMFIEEAEPSGIALVCHFEAVNEGMMRVLPDKTELTASGQAYAMMQRHAGGRLLHAAADSAATMKEGVLTVTAVNPSYDRPRRVSVRSGVGEAEAWLYTCDRVAPHTQFERTPVVPVRDGDVWQVEMPAHSMLLLQVKQQPEG